MTQDKQTTLTLEQAQKLLQSFNCLTPKIVESEAEKLLVRQALLLVHENSDYQILGICAETPEQALIALETYAKTFGYQPKQLDITNSEGPVYIKFNPKSGLCYIEPYTGEHRGVLVSCQSAYSDGINEMYGHLPLNLFSSPE